jgi:CubicO group peptidase (beta-lactamase class C family)
MNAILLCAVLLAQEDKLEAAFRGVREAVERDEIPGAIALVAKDGKVLRHEAFGFCDPERRTPFLKETLCWMASITKPVTAAAVMTLVDAGKVALDDPVEKHLPEFKGRGFTVRQLLSHTSGLPANPPTRKRDGKGPGGAVDESWLTQSLPDIVRSIAAAEPQFKPGERVMYSNSGYFVLGRMIEVLAGEPYADVVRRKLLDPLGMKDSTFVPTDPARVSSIYRELQGRRAPDFRFDPGVKIVNTAPDGGLFTNPGELVRFVQLFLDDDGKVLSRASVAEMLKEQAPGRGLGWALSKDGTFSHGGSSGTYAWGDPRQRVVGILFLQYWGSDKVGKVREGFVRGVAEMK